MSWKEIARDAIEKANETYKLLIRLETIVESSEKATAEFRLQQRQRQEEFERRVLDQVERNMRKFDETIERYRQRTVDLESRTASLDGKFSGIATEALNQAILSMLENNPKNSTLNNKALKEPSYLSQKGEQQEPTL